MSDESTLPPDPATIATRRVEEIRAEYIGGKLTWRAQDISPMLGALDNRNREIERLGARVAELEVVVRAADAIAAAITHDHLAEHDERHTLLSDYTIARAKVEVPRG